MDNIKVKIIEQRRGGKHTIKYEENEIPVLSIIYLKIVNEIANLFLHLNSSPLTLPYLPFQSNPTLPLPLLFFISPSSFQFLSYFLTSSQNLHSSSLSFFLLLFFTILFIIYSILFVLQTYAPLRPLVLVLKYFLTRKGLCEAFTGGLSSYALLLVTARFLQEVR